MKNLIALIFAAGILVLAGCCTAPHATRWEYKVAVLPHASANEVPENIHALQQRLLNDLGKDGWALVSENDGRVFYFKRLIK